MDNTNSGISCSFYTVKQLASLFNKSEDTIRRWKNEGIGKDEDNMKLRAIEKGGSEGRRNARHLVFSREAVIEFVRANPFLMDDAPQLNMMMQAEGAWRGGAIPMPGGVEPETSTMSPGVRDFLLRLGTEDLGDMAEEAVGTAFIRDKAPEHERPSFVYRHRREAPPPPEFDDETFDTDGWAKSAWEEDPEDKWGEGVEIDDEPFDEWERGSRSHSSRSRRRPRRGPSIDYERQLRVINFALDTIREHRSGLEKEIDELDEALTELELSGMPQHSVRAIKQVTEQRIKKIEEEQDMLRDFIELIEEEIS